jgi:dihydroorotase-like cyclic amidohydrolase
VSEGPARRFGLWPRKGSLAPGADADLLVLDPDADWEIDPARLITAAGWSPYTGRRVKGRVIAAYSRGRLVWDGEQVIGQPGEGTFVPAAGDRVRAQTATIGAHV